MTLLVKTPSCLKIQTQPLRPTWWTERASHLTVTCAVCTFFSLTTHTSRLQKILLNCILLPRGKPEQQRHGVDPTGPGYQFICSLAISYLYLLSHYWPKPYNFFFKLDTEVLSDGAFVNTTRAISLLPRVKKLPICYCWTSSLPSSTKLTVF